MKTTLNALVAIALIAITALSPQIAHAETVTYYHMDALGSPVAATDASGNILWREEYAPYGDRIRIEDSNNALWYTGKFHEEDIGLTYFGARWYDPVAGRFMGIDPVEYREADSHSFNRYAYANNNPYKYVDPDGRRSTLKVIDIILSGSGEERFGPNFVYGPHAPQLKEGVIKSLDGRRAVVKDGNVFLEPRTVQSGARAKTDPLLDALSNAKPTKGHPNQLMHVLDDGTRILFRKDFGNKAHHLGGPFQGKGKVDHYNVEVQDARGKIIENIHLVPDGKDGFVRWGKDGVVK